MSKTATIIKNVLLDAHVVADVSGMLPWFTSNMGNKEEYARRLEASVKEFHDFLRDHRSQDMVKLEVVRKISDICSNCKNEKEVFYEPSGAAYCAHCGALIPEEDTIR
jgi:hypothetical protein